MGHLAHDAHAPPFPREPRLSSYRRRQPEETVLYQTIAEHWPAFRERAEEAGGLPRFIVEEFDEYLRCGILERGCLHLVCQSCGYEELVALSCKKRGFCPSCIGRRMADTAVQLEQHVLPAVPIRHWICSLPWGLRSLLGYDKRLCASVVSGFVGELSRSLKRRAKQALGLSGMSEALTGAVAAVSRTDSALRLNVHFHVLALDGVYVRLIAAVPPPRWHTLRYFGVLSSHCAVRSEIVPKPPPDTTQRRPPPAAGDQLELPGSAGDGGDDDASELPKRRRWAWLIRHVFRADVDTCRRCGEPMRWRDAAGTPQAAERLLAKLGLAPQPPPALQPPPLGAAHVALPVLGRLPRVCR